MTRIVLVHGAWADSSSWSGVVERLQRDGHVVHSIPNQLRSLAGDSAYVAGFLQTIREPIVLVGHSYGGAVVSNAATGNPNVKALRLRRWLCSRAGRKRAATGAGVCP